MSFPPSEFPDQTLPLMSVIDLNTLTTHTELNTLYEDVCERLECLGNNLYFTREPRCTATPWYACSSDEEGEELQVSSLKANEVITVSSGSESEEEMCFESDDEDDDTDTYVQMHAAGQSTSDVKFVYVEGKEGQRPNCITVISMPRMTVQDFGLVSYLKGNSLDDMIDVFARTGEYKMMTCRTLYSFLFKSNVLDDTSTEQCMKFLHENFGDSYGILCEGEIERRSDTTKEIEDSVTEMDVVWKNFQELATKGLAILFYDRCT